MCLFCVRLPIKRKMVNKFLLKCVRTHLVKQKMTMAKRIIPFCQVCDEVKQKAGQRAHSDVRGRLCGGSCGY